MASPVGIGCVLLATAAGRIQIAAVNPDGGAASSGNVKPGDFLVALNGVCVASAAHAKELTLGHFGTSLEVELARDDKTVNVTIWRGGADGKAKGEADAKAKAAHASSAALKEESRECALTKENEVVERSERCQLEYRVVVEGSVTALTQSVNGLLAQGWKLQGGVSAHTRIQRVRSFDCYDELWSQAMTTINQ